MKEVATVLLIAFMLGCSSSSTPTTTTSPTGLWSASLPGGIGQASGLSFTTQFTVNGDGSLNITFFQFLNNESCFPITGGTQSGSMTLTTDTSNNTVTGPFTFTVQSGNNTLTLTGNVTGSATVTSSSNTLSGGSITGSWTLTGDNGCNATGDLFTMKQTS